MELELLLLLLLLLLAKEEVGGVGGGVVLRVPLTRGLATFVSPSTPPPPS